MASLVGPSPDSYNGSSNTGYGNFVNGDTAVNIGTNFIYATDNTPGSPFAVGTLNWTGTDLVTLSFDYILSGAAGSNNNIQYGFGWSGAGPTLITTYGSGHVSSTFDLSQLTGDTLFVEAYADGLNSNASISNINVTSTPVPAAAYLFGSGLLGLVGLSRKKEK
jgi:hypothetical protein